MPSRTAYVPNLIGIVIDDRYAMMSKMGAGSYGVVYKAIDSDCEGDDETRTRAVKVVAKAGRKPAYVHALRREMDLHSRVSAHPNIITLHETFELPDFAVFVMDASSRGDLESWISSSERPCADERVLRTIFTELLDAVAFMHGHGVYHRDIKPANVLIDTDPLHVYLADFGLATEDEQYTRRVGTQSYMPPECVTATAFEVPESASAAASDVWALAIVFLNVLTGRVLWWRAMREHTAYTQFRARPAAFLLDMLPIDPTLAAVLAGMLAEDPRERVSAAAAR
ncbi:kinase-like protein, partial [Epithele typhae]|uniref:kinase-like protein n=1 Tax=Epithele typhae TaxID=378194 RepID=UPI002007876D